MVRLLEVITPVPRDAWAEVLRAAPHAGVMQTPDWLDCICDAGPWSDASRLYRFDDGRRAVLPFARRRLRPVLLAREASWPFDWGAGGPVADGPVGVDHTRLVFADLLANPALQRTLRPHALADPAWQAAPAGFAREEHATQILDLHGGFDTVWQTQFRSSVRRAVRKAEVSGLRVEVDRGGRLVDVFNGLYLSSVDRWAAAQHEPRAVGRWRASRANPPHKFHTVAQRLGERCAVWVAWHGDRPVASLIVLRQGSHAKYWRGAMDRELAAPTRANDLLHRLVIEDACLSGCVTYDMGDSRPGSGLARFKAGFGAQTYVSHSLRSERLPLSRIDKTLRHAAKRALGFQDL